MGKSVQNSLRARIHLFFWNLIIGLKTGGGVWKTKQEQAASHTLSSTPFVITQPSSTFQT